MARDETARRRSLLLQSIELAQSLASVLRGLGPSTYLRCRSGPQNEAGFQENKLLENTLHRELQCAMEARNDSVSAVARMPDDLLQDIFTIASASEDEDDMIAYSRSRTPMQLLQVSRRWRHVALDTATLWRSVEFHGRGHAVDQLHSRLPASYVFGQFMPFRTIERKPVISDISQFCLEQVKTSPLNVRLFVDAGCDKFGAVMLSNKISQLVDRCLAVQELEIVLQRRADENIAKAILDLLRSAAQTLRKLSIDGLYTRPVTSFTSLPPLEMPRLRELRLKIVELPKAFSFATFATIELLNLDVSAASDCSLQEVIGLLTSCTRLTKLSLKLRTHDDPMATADPVRAGPLLLFNLRNLGVHGTPREIAPLLYSLHAPSLKQLGVYCSTMKPADRDASAALLQSVIAVLSAAFITHVAVELFTVDLVLQLMEHLTTVTTFSFHICRGEDEDPTRHSHRVFDKLLQLQLSNGKKILPLLRSLNPNYPITSQSLSHHLGFLQDLDKRGRGLDSLEFPRWQEALPGWGPNEPPHTLNDICVLEECIARLVPNFVIGAWRFDVGSRRWQRSTWDK